MNPRHRTGIRARSVLNWHFCRGVPAIRAMNTNASTGPDRIWFRYIVDSPGILFPTRNLNRILMVAGTAGKNELTAKLN